MTIRNDLIEKIVIAAGGTVRNPNNRNMLLEDWLEAFNLNLEYVQTESGEFMISEVGSYIITEASK